MLTLLYFLLYIILFILVIILLVVILPLTISTLSSIDGFVYKAFMNISILLGVVQGSVSITSDGGVFKLRLFWFQVYNKPLAEEEEKPKKKKIKKPKRKRKGSPSKLIRPIRRLLSDLKRVFKVRRLNVDLVAGLSDPYTLGLMLGTAYPIVEMMNVFFPPLNLSLTPDFQEERFASKLDGKISLRVILLVIPLLRFFMSKEFREYRRS